MGLFPYALFNYITSNSENAGFFIALPTVVKLFGVLPAWVIMKLIMTQFTFLSSLRLLSFLIRVIFIFFLQTNICSYHLPMFFPSGLLPPFKIDF